MAFIRTKGPIPSDSDNYYKYLIWTEDGEREQKYLGPADGPNDKKVTKEEIPEKLRNKISFDNEIENDKLRFKNDEDKKEFMSNVSEDLENEKWKSKDRKEYWRGYSEECDRLEDRVKEIQKDEDKDVEELKEYLENWEDNQWGSDNSDFPSDHDKKGEMDVVNKILNDLESNKSLDNIRKDLGEMKDKAFKKRERQKGIVDGLNRVQNELTSKGRYDNIKIEEVNTREGIADEISKMAKNEEDDAWLKGIDRGIEIAEQDIRKAPSDYIDKREPYSYISKTDDKYYNISQNPPDKYEDFMTPEWAKRKVKDISKNAQPKMGKVKGEDEWEVQSVMIEKENHSEDEAEELAKRVKKKIEEE